MGLKRFPETGKHEERVAGERAIRFQGEKDFGATAREMELGQGVV